jgi:hypothetical protein
MTTQPAETTAPTGAVVGAPPDLVLGEAPHWVAAAVCAGTDPEIFLPREARIDSLREGDLRALHRRRGVPHLRAGT